MPIGLNEVIDRGINVALQRRLGLSAQATVSLMPELAPVMDLGPMPELLYNLGWRRYAHSLQNAQVAGQRAHQRLRVVQSQPGTPNVLVVLESIVIDGNAVAGQQCFVDLLGTATADLTNPFPNHAACDYRQLNAGGSLTNGSQVILSQAVDGTAATLGIYYSGFLATPGAFVPGILGICLTGGMGVQVDVTTINVPSTVQWIWRERIMNDAEIAR